MKKFVLSIVIVVILLVILTSCATTPVKQQKNWYNEEIERLKIVHQAEELVGTRDLRKISSAYRNDCSGFVLGLYRSLGYIIRLNNPRGRRYTLSQLIYINLRQNGLIYMNRIPEKADLVFFKGTVRSMPNRISHVGIVDDIMADRTVVIIHYSSKGVSRLRMNLLYPHRHQSKNGKILNDFIIKRNNSIEGRYLLAAEHFAGYGDLYSYCMYKSKY